jgi:capsular polysaccharide biosynthesis protein
MRLTCVKGIWRKNMPISPDVMFILLFLAFCVGVVCGVVLFVAFLAWASRRCEDD